MAKASLDSSRQLRSPYTLDDVYIALRLLAWFGGNLNRAARALHADGHPISKRTLERWSQDQHADVYAEMTAEAHQEASQRSLVRALRVVAAQLDDSGSVAKLDAIVRAGG